MSVPTSDILVEISDAQLPKLANLYEGNASWAPYVTALVHTGIKWKQSKNYKDLIKFFSPNNSWENDGTTIVTILFSVIDIHVFTLEDSCNNLYRGLMETKIIDFGKVKTLYAIHEKHVAAVRKFVNESNFAALGEIRGFIYNISPPEAKHFDVVVPPEVYIGKLDPSAAVLVNALWPHSFPGSENYLAKYIETGGGYGVFLKATNEMVAWTLKHVQGNMTMLQTAEEFKRKGYASLVIKVLAKEIGAEGHWPTATVMIDNEKVINLFEKLGFRRIARCVFFFLGH